MLRFSVLLLKWYYVLTSCVFHRFPVNVSRRWSRLWFLKPPRLDWPSDGAQKTQALLQVPNAGAGKRVPIQRLRVKAETMGARAKSKPYRETSQNMVPEPKNEE